MLGSVTEADDAVQEAWLRLAVANGRIVEIDIIADPEKLRGLDVARTESPGDSNQ